MSSNYVNLESEERAQDSSNKWSARWIGKVALISVVLVVVVVVCVGAATSGASQVEANGVSQKLANQMDDSFVATDRMNRICYLSKESGPCRAYFPRYFFNKCTGKCEKFIYGGCLGNANNFRSLAECRAKCRFNPVLPCPKLTAAESEMEEEEEEEEKAVKKVVTAKDTGADVKAKQDYLGCSIYKLSSAGAANVYIGKVGNRGSVYKLSSAGAANVFVGKVGQGRVSKLSSAGAANVFIGKVGTRGNVYKVSSAGAANVFVGRASSQGRIYKVSSAGAANVYVGKAGGKCSIEQKGGAALLLGLM